MAYRHTLDNKAQLTPAGSSIRPTHRLLAFFGLIVPFPFIFTAILGGVLRPGYSHLAETVSELLTRGASKKPLLDSLHVTFTLLLSLFGIGVWPFVWDSGCATRGSRPGAAIQVKMGSANVAAATIFPEDPLVMEVTVIGQLRQIMSGVVSLQSLGAMLLLGIWFRRTGLWPFFRTFSLVIISIVVPASAFFATRINGPYMGLAERLTFLPGFVWLGTLAWWLLTRAETPMQPAGNNI